MRLRALVGVGVAAVTACGHPAIRPGPASVAFPETTAGDTPKLVFHVAVPRAAGSLEAQTDQALEDLLSRDPQAQMLRLRVFAVGQTRLDTLERLIGASLLARRATLPALSLIGVQSLPRPGQLVEMESIATQTRVLNPSGVVFLAGLASPSGGRTAAGLAKVAQAAGVSPASVLRVSCFYESVEQADEVEQAVRDTFPSAEALFVHSYGSSSAPAVECEAVARLTDAVPATQYVNLPGSKPSPNFSRAARVSAPRLLFTGALQALGDSASDMRALMDRATRVVGLLGADLHDVAMADNYWLTATARDALRPARNEAYGTTVPAATGVFMTSLASPRGTVALEFIVPISGHPSH